MSTVEGFHCNIINSGICPCPVAPPFPPPPQVARHLAKLFDSMAKLKFVEGAESKPTKEALAMWSTDREFVNFDKPRMCVGRVESWLNDLLDTMTSTIRHEFMEAVVTYEEKAREQWIFDPPAQVGWCSE